MEERGQLEPGAQFERYTVLRTLAFGGMADVYEASHSYVGRVVALKLLQRRHLGDTEALRRARNEIAILSRLDHPNVVRILDAGIADSGVVWMAMERLDGCTLRRLLHACGPLGPRLAVWIARHIASGVAAAHELGAIHRDLKPENVFITQQRQVKVLDLGAAKLHGADFESTALTRSVGTPAYMAPEQVCGARLDGRVDVYALGVLLYEMLAGVHPLAGPGGEMPVGPAWGPVHLERAPVPLGDRVPGSPPELGVLLERALAKEPAARFATVRELETALRLLPHQASLTEERQLFDLFGATDALSTGALPPAPATQGASGVTRDISRDIATPEGMPPSRQLGPTISEWRPTTVAPRVRLWLRGLALAILIGLPLALGAALASRWYRGTSAGEDQRLVPATLPRGLGTERAHERTP